MKKERMTIEELRELNPTPENPVELVCDDGCFITNCLKIQVLSVGGKQLFIKDAYGHESLLDHESLRHYPSQKQPKIETLYECLSNAGAPTFYFKDGRFPIFENKLKSSPTSKDALKRKTGRTLKINMETFELVDDENE